MLHLHHQVVHCLFLHLILFAVLGSLQQVHLQLLLMGKELNVILEVGPTVIHVIELVLHEMLSSHGVFVACRREKVIVVCV